MPYRQVFVTQRCSLKLQDAQYEAVLFSFSWWLHPLKWMLDLMEY